MAKYRKKPVVIEAFQWNPRAAVSETPMWFFDACNDKKIWPELDGTASITTLEGKMTAQIGDFIIQGVKGEIYPCKPDIFEATYERVES